MKKIKSIIIALLVLVIGSFSLNAQNINDLRQKAYEAAIEATMASKSVKSDYEEYLERQELEAAKKAEEERKAEEEALEAKEAEAKEAEEEKRKDELYDILSYYVFTVTDSENLCMKCYCYPMDAYIWYNFHHYPDGHRVKLYYDDNGDVGDLFFNSLYQDFQHITAVFDSTDTRTEAIRMKLEKEYIIFIQDPEDPYKFSIAW